MAASPLRACDLVHAPTILGGSREHASALAARERWPGNVILKGCTMTDRSTMDGSTTDGPTTDGPEHAWLLGRTAGLSDAAADANPYDAGSELAADWADGWREGTKLGNHPVDGPQAWAE
jgi:ribosome modulation factor